MKIYTSYFAKEKKMPKNIFRLSICLYPPKGVQFPYLHQFLPTKIMLTNYKDNGNESEFRYEYKRKILDKIDIDKLKEDLNVISNGQDLVLLCYEKTGDFCHRQLVLEYLNKLGYYCEEYKN